MRTGRELNRNRRKRKKNISNSYEKIFYIDNDCTAGRLLQEETLPKLEENRVRAEGSGTSRDMHMAAEIARINAMTVLAGKVSPADTLTEAGEDGIVRTSVTVNTPVFDVTEVDRRVFKNRTTDDYTVWILLEADVER